MKNKQQKSSNYHYSTKTKARKQAFSEDFSENLSKTTVTAKKHPNQGKNFRWSREGHTSAPFFMDSNSDTGDKQPKYKYEQPPETKIYCYDYTDSQFIYFLGQLKPKEYLLFITILAVLITENLNVTEKRIVFAFVSNLADTIQTLYEQEVILASYRQTKGIRDLNNALHIDFDNIYKEIGRLKRPRP